MIINCKNQPRKVTLTSILRGECFIDDDGDLMMKIETIGRFNCIDVSTGIAYEYDEGYYVIPIKARVEYSY